MSNLGKIILVLAFIGSNLCYSQLVEAHTITIVGSRSCEQWTKDRSLRNKVVSSYDWIDAAMSESWLLGVLNGMNYGANAEKDIFYSADANLIFVWMDRYCKASKTSTVFEGAKRLYREL